MKSTHLIILAIISFVSCKAPLTVIHKNEIKNITPTILYDSLIHNYGKIDSYFGKFKATIKQDKKCNTVYGTAKIRRDSILWFSVNPGMGIEIARAQMMHDSLFVMDRFNSRYFKGRYDYIDKLLDVEVDFESLQSIFLNTLSFYTSSVDTQQVLKNLIIKKEKSGKFIQIENYRKRSIKKNEGDILLPPVYQRIKVDNRNLKISEVFVKDFKDNKQMKIEYSDFVYNDSLKVDFPQTINVKVDKGNKVIELIISFSKQEFNQPNTYQFTIPTSYKPIEIKQ
jgi:hypothetical protein